MPQWLDSRSLNQRHEEMIWEAEQRRLTELSRAGRRTSNPPGDPGISVFRRGPQRLGARFSGLLKLLSYPIEGA